MKKRFEIWSEYQEIMFEPRSFVGCSVYDCSKREKEPLTEVMERGSLGNNPENQNIGKNLAELVLKQFKFNEGDEIGTIDRRESSGLRSIGSYLLMPIFYSTSRNPVQGPRCKLGSYRNEVTFVNGFIDYLESHKQSK